MNIQNFKQTICYLFSSVKHKIDNMLSVKKYVLQLSCVYHIYVVSLSIEMN